MISYRDNQKVYSDDDDDDSDSDKECSVWKRAAKTSDKDCSMFDKTEVVSVDNNILQNNTENKELISESTICKKRKKNTIWSDVLQDQLISEDLGSCLLKNKPVDYGNRGHESYDYTLKYTLPEYQNRMDCAMSDDEISHDIDTSSVTSFKKNFNSKKFVKLDGAERAAANKIIKVLHEKKAYLIYRVVKEIGINKAMTLLKMTEEVEEKGGMMVKNNARRRTPGGVYFQLLKSDEEVTKEMIDRIFEGEMNAIEMKKYYAEKRKKKKEFLKQKKAERAIQKIQVPKAELDALVSDAYDVNMSNIENCPKVSVAPVPEQRSSNSDLEDGELQSDNEDPFN